VVPITVIRGKEVTRIGMVTPLREGAANGSARFTGY
jgi:hypothetical protein